MAHIHIPSQDVLPDGGEVTLDLLFSHPFDGGPVMEMARPARFGVLRAGAPIVPYALSVQPAWRLKTWDRFIIPFPFTRGAIVLGTPISTARTTPLEVLQAQLQEQLDAATVRADMLAAGKMAFTTDPAPQ